MTRHYRIRHAFPGLLAIVVSSAILAGAAAGANDIFIPVLVYRTGPFASSGIPVANGLVDYEIDIDILRPADPARANGVVLYEVTNRGNKLIGRMNGVVPANPLNPIELNNPTAAAHAGTGFLFERGTTFVWSGWDPTLPKRDGLMGVRFPLALENGQPMVRRIREEFQVGKRIASSDTIVLTYPAASLDKSKARLMVRRCESDARTEIVREVPVPARGEPDGCRERRARLGRAARARSRIDHVQIGNAETRHPLNEAGSSARNIAHLIFRVDQLQFLVQRHLPHEHIGAPMRREIHTGSERRRCGVESRIALARVSARECGRQHQCHWPTIDLHVSLHECGL